MLDDTEDGVVMRFPGTRSLAPGACRRRLALFVSLLAAILATLAAVGGGASAAARGEALGQRLRRARTFALALGVDLRAPVAVAKLSRYELVVVDGVDAPRAAIRRLRQRGAVVLGYLSVGSIERGRFWTKRALPYALGQVPGWPERYADVARPGYRRLLTKTVAPTILERGFDGLFLDNVDAVETYPHLRTGMRKLVAALAELVHRRGRLLFAQNADAFTRTELVHLLDGWNREDVSWRYDFDRQTYAPVTRGERARALSTLKALRRAGLVVTTTDYPPPGNRRAALAAVYAACSAGALPWISDIDLAALPPEPWRCSTTANARTSAARK